MSMLNAPRTVVRNQPDDLHEDQLTTATVRSLGFFEEHRTAVIGAVVGLVALVVGVVGYQTWQANRDEAAAEQLGAVLTAYEQGAYEDALTGGDGRPGLVAIADDFGSTATGNLATFFAADALFQLGRYDEALRYFEAYDAGSDILGASALAGQAAVHEQAGDHARAAGLYERAAQAWPTIATAPGYLMDAGRAYEAAGDYASALRAYEGVKEYENSELVQTVDIDIARVEALQAAAN